MFPNGEEAVNKFVDSNIGEALNKFSKAINDSIDKTFTSQLEIVNRQQLTDMESARDEIRGFNWSSNAVKVFLFHLS